MKTAEELYRKHNNITTGFEFKEALAEACKEQREICATTAIEIWMGLMNDDFYNGIKNAPSPLGDKK